MKKMEELAGHTLSKVSDNALLFPEKLWLEQIETAQGFCKDKFCVAKFVTCWKGKLSQRIFFLLNKVVIEIMASHYFKQKVYPKLKGGIQYI